MRKHNNNLVNSKGTSTCFKVVSNHITYYKTNTIFNYFNLLYIYIYHVFGVLGVLYKR